uniref:Uncharacterized protein n=1 Tax=Timema bartmani TaxID=61472 RepID=A0A7R9EVL0_9NEOP|nr:unnamed protein product [Timema bartmani]
MQSASTSLKTQSDTRCQLRALWGRRHGSLYRCLVICYERSVNADLRRLPGNVRASTVSYYPFGLYAYSLMNVVMSPDKDPSSKGYLQILLRGPRHCVLLSAALAVATAALLILVILLTVHKYDAQQVIAQTTGSPKDDEYESTFKYADTNTTLSGRLRILTRREWLAQPPLHPMDSLYHPVPYVIISHTATEPCVKQADCTFFVRTVQTFHIESFGWWDIGYNFLVGGDGYAYEGRGWNHVGAHAHGYNNVSIGISIIGTFISVLPPDSQLMAAKQLIQRGVELGKVSPNYKLLGHRQVSATESPGTALYDEIKTWPNWIIVHHILVCSLLYLLQMLNKLVSLVMMNGLLCERLVRVTQGLRLAVSMKLIQYTAHVF